MPMPVTMTMPVSGTCKAAALKGLQARTPNSPGLWGSGPTKGPGSQVPLSVLAVLWAQRLFSAAPIGSRRHGTAQAAQPDTWQWGGELDQNK